MNKKSMTLFAAGACCALLVTTSAVRSQDGEGGMAMDASAMAAMMPGPMHAPLAKLAGEWNITGKYRMTPDGEWVEFNGQGKRELVFEGRHMVEQFESEFMGMPYNGSGVTGYDNVRGEYNSVWYDNSSTGMMVCTGSANDAGTEITLLGEHSDAMTGETHKWFKMRHRIVAADNTIFESYAKTESGEEWLSMELNYKRK